MRRRLLLGAGCTTTCCSWWAHTLQVLHRRRLRGRGQHAGNSLSQCQARRLQQRQSQGLLAVPRVAVLQLQLLRPARRLLKVVHKELLWRVSRTRRCWTRLSSLPCTHCWPLYKRVRTCDGCNGDRCDVRGLPGCCCLSSCLCLCAVANGAKFSHASTTHSRTQQAAHAALQPQLQASRAPDTTSPCNFCLPFAHER